MSRESGDQGKGRSVSHRQTGEAADGVWCAGLANTIQDGVYRLDGDRHVTAVNDALVELTGYSGEELLGEHVSVLFEADAFARSELAIRRLSSGEDRDVETVNVKLTPAAGERIPCSLRVGTADSEDEGATVGVLTAVDDGDSADAEAAARQSDVPSDGETQWERSQQFERMVDAVEDYAIFLLDPDGRVVTWNEGAKRLKGY